MKHSYIKHHNVISQKTSNLISSAAEPQTSDLSQDDSNLLFKKSIAAMKHKEQDWIHVISQIYSLLLCIHYNIHFCRYKVTVIYDKRGYLSTVSWHDNTQSDGSADTLQLKMPLLSPGYQTCPENGGSKLLSMVNRLLADFTMLQQFPHGLLLWGTKQHSWAKTKAG